MTLPTGLYDPVEGVTLPYSPHTQSLVTLVEAGLKPAGWLEPGTSPIPYRIWGAHLAQKGLEHTIPRGDWRTSYENQEEAEEIAQQAHATGIACLEEPWTKSLLLKDIPYGLLFWKKTPSTAPPAYAENMQDFGLLLGYPSCCVHMLREGSALRFGASLRDRLATHGLPGIEHLVGIHHIPCGVDCHATARLGYAPFLKDAHPQLYEAELNRLLGMAQGMSGPSP